MVCDVLHCCCCSCAWRVCVAGVALHNLFTMNAADFPDAASQQLTGSVTFGAFSGCFNIDAVDPQYGPWSVHHCYSLSSSCTVTVHVQTVSTTETVSESLSFCPEFNAFRSFAVIGVILLGFALVLMFLSLRFYTDNGAIKWSGFGLAIGSIIAIVISYSLAADILRKEDPDNLVQKGPAFPLCVTAWVLMVLGAGLFLVAKRFEQGTYSKDEGSIRKQMDKDTSASDTDTVRE